MIVGWQLASHMRTDLVLDALRMALATRSPGVDFTLVAHTDHGSQPGLSEDYTQQLDDARVLASVGSVGDAYDHLSAGHPLRGDDRNRTGVDGFAEGPDGEFSDAERRNRP